MDEASIDKTPDGADEHPRRKTSRRRLNVEALQGTRAVPTRRINLLKKDPVSQRELTEALNSMSTEITNTMRANDDRLRRAVAADIRNLTRDPTEGPSLNLNLWIIPDVPDRQRALALLKGIRAAVATLEEVAEDETTRRITGKSITPKIDELEQLLSTEAVDASDALEQRRNAFSLVNAVQSLVRNVGIAVGVLGGVDEAAENVRRAADAAERALDEADKLQWLWDLLSALAFGG